MRAGGTKTIAAAGAAAAESASAGPRVDRGPPVGRGPRAFEGMEDSGCIVELFVSGFNTVGFEKGAPGEREAAKKRQMQKKMPKI